MQPTSHLNGATKPQRRNAISLFIEREFKARVQNQAFRLTTVALIILSAIVASIPIIIEYFQSNQQVSMVIVNTAGTIAGQDPIQFIDESLNLPVEDQKTTPEQKPRFAIKPGQADQIDAFNQQVRTSDLDALLVIKRMPSEDLGFEYYSNEPLTSLNLAQVQTAAMQLNVREKLARFGVAEPQQEAIFATPEFQARSVIQELSGRTEAENNSILGMTFAIIALLFMTLSVLGTAVASGVAQEKSTRVMEILITAARPFDLMLGKIIGIGLSGLLQMVAVVISVSIALAVQQPLRAAILGDTSIAAPIDVSSISFSLLGLLLLYFILGFMLYAALFAAVGAVLNSQEEVANAGAPINLLMSSAYLASWYATSTPEASWIAPLSYVPFFTPTLMLARLAIGNLAWWEILLSSIIMVISILLLTWIAGRIYRVGVLMYGRKPSFTRTLKLIVSG